MDLKYYVSGKIIDEAGKPVVGAIVTDLKDGTASDVDGEYNFETAANKLYVKMIGFKDAEIDLSKYTIDSSVRANVTLSENKSVTESSKSLDISVKKSYRTYWSGGITGLVLGTTTYFISKKFTSNIYVIIGSSIIASAAGYALGYSLVSSAISKVKQKKTDKELAKK